MRIPRGASPRVPAELQKLGFDVSERTVSRYMPKRPVEPDVVERWKIFLRNHRHAISAMDFFTVPTVTFDVLYILFVIHHDRRKVLHLNVTPLLSAEWVVQQLREAFPYETIPRYLIFDRDGKFGLSVVAAIKAMGIKPSRTGYLEALEEGKNPFDADTLAELLRPRRPRRDNTDDEEKRR